jgi:hypothetical protein
MEPQNIVPKFVEEGLGITMKDVRYLGRYSSRMFPKFKFGPLLLSELVRLECAADHSLLTSVCGVVAPEYAMLS